ncbi:putative fungal Zn(2)-cys(6) binuclear cluster domain protein [Rhizoctonia solani 123E]|uniref:Putative fungal Zn(2)-cys(6) binuclear cluster domain protein n=1 Tax=Rhizoctonia solani 123E TaxID=1423351 RepID=A0A074S8Y4_9AGAM|nr:putative fungal Zn(2)-cys(6) binuclear cluster domain protein [Rhizoctonia solani 123E]
MSCAKLKPGPSPTSCLTCRQRHQRCDLARPRCGRCAKGGYECLGYSDSRQDPHVPISSQPQPDPTAILVSAERPELADLGTSGFDSKQLLNFETEDQQYFDRTCANPDLTSSIFGSAIVYGMVGSAPLGGSSYADVHVPDDNIHMWSRNQSQSATYEPSLARRDSNATKPSDNVSAAEHGDVDFNINIQALFTSIPASVDATHILRDGYLTNIIGEYQAWRVRYWFATPPPSVRDAFMGLKGSKAIIRAVYLGATLFQAVNKNSGGTGALKCIGWIDELERRFDRDFYNSSTLSDAGDYLLAELELAFIKSSMISSTSGYVVLQKALPRFLHLLAVDPNLYSEHRDGNLVVSFPRTFSTPQYELKRFVMLDTIATLVLGVPPLIEYGYDGECDPVSHGLECIHGVPVVLVETICQVNSWRAGSRVAPLDDWKTLEKRVMNWQTQPPIGEGGEGAVENIARFAIQESWRQVVLIYIYMGMCGASSHDARVQASIRQIIQLGEVVANLPIGAHMFVHCVVVSRFRSTV